MNDRQTIQSYLEQFKHVWNYPKLKYGWSRAFEMNGDISDFIPNMENSDFIWMLPSYGEYGKRRECGYCGKECDDTYGAIVVGITYNYCSIMCLYPTTFHDEKIIGMIRDAILDRNIEECGQSSVM